MIVKTKASFRAGVLDGGQQRVAANLSLCKVGLLSCPSSMDPPPASISYMSRSEYPTGTLDVHMRGIKMPRIHRSLLPSGG